MRSQETWVALLAALAVAAGVWLIAAQPVSDQAESAHAAPPSSSASTSAAVSASSAPVARGGIGTQAVAQAPASAVTAADAAADATLPALGVPLAQVIDDLEARARAGDARAACRLASELSRCASVPVRRAYSPLRADVPASWSPKTSDQSIDAAARYELALEQDDAICKDIPFERTRTATTFLLQAARAGQPAAREAFLAGDWLTDPAVVRHPDAVAAFAREAESMARALLDSNAPLEQDQLALLGLAFTGKPEFMIHLREAVAPDPVLARALVGLAQEAGARAESGGILQPDAYARIVEDLDTRLSDAERVAARATMDRLRSRIRPRAAPDSNFGIFLSPDPADCAR